MINTNQAIISFLPNLEILSLPSKKRNGPDTIDISDKGKQRKVVTHKKWSDVDTLGILNYLNDTTLNNGEMEVRHISL